MVGYKGAVFVRASRYNDFLQVDSSISIKTKLKNHIFCHFHNSMLTVPSKQSLYDLIGQTWYLLFAISVTILACSHRVLSHMLGASFP